MSDLNHELKTDPEVFDAVARGEKAFEIRKDDRGFQVGDTLYLLKTRHTGAEMREGMPLEYTGDKLTRKVGYLLRGPIYGLAEGWVIMGFADTAELAALRAERDEAERDRDYWKRLAKEGERKDALAQRACELMRRLFGIQYTHILGAADNDEDTALEIGIKIIAKRSDALRDRAERAESDAAESKRRCGELETCLRKCQATFREYATIHRLKKSSVGEIKATLNDDRADYIERVLSPAAITPEASK